MIGALASATLIALLAFPRTGMGLTFLVTILAFGVIYEWCHYLIHTDYKPKGAVYRVIWRDHRLHHFKNEHYWCDDTGHGQSGAAHLPRPRLGADLADGQEPARRGRGQPLTTTGSPMLTWLKYQDALSGLRLMQPWLTLA